MHWKQKGPTDVAKGMQRKPDKMLPFNEIGHAKEKSLLMKTVNHMYLLRFQVVVG